LPTGEAFSANFATEELLKQFCKNVMVTAAHVARYTSVELAETLLQVTAPDTSSVTEPGDTCGVVYAVWDLPSGSSLAPNAGLALAPASDNGGEIIKLKAGDTKGEPVQVFQYIYTHIYMYIFMIQSFHWTFCLLSVFPQVLCVYLKQQNKRIRIKL
jgi:hypothetical protein